ncbi:hypothetical protein FRB93_014042 [Tulasnella sp. JGI-2019a]|nr:hypothetical protein FRB93_014042 [Tulasnella sp. JGI-2019a]
MTPATPTRGLTPDCLKKCLQAPHQRPQCDPTPWKAPVMNKPYAPLGPPSALATAHAINDLDKIVSHKCMKAPGAELNEYALQGGKFRYDCDFLLRFMEVCKQRPDRLVPLGPESIRRFEVGHEEPTAGLRTQAGKRKSKGLLGPLGSTVRSASSTRLTDTFVPSSAATEGFVMTHGVYSGDVDGIRDVAGEPLSASVRKGRPEPPGHTFLSVQDRAHQQKLDCRRQWEPFNVNLNPVELLHPSENRWIPTSRAGPSIVEGDGEALVDRYAHPDKNVQRSWTNLHPALLQRFTRPERAGVLVTPDFSATTILPPSTINEPPPSPAHIPRVQQLGPFPDIPESPARATTAIEPQHSVDMSEPPTAHDRANAELSEEIPASISSAEPNQNKSWERPQHDPIPWQVFVMNKPFAPLGPPSALATVQVINNLDKIVYPEWIKMPDIELNKHAMQGGRFKYDRDFLLQFMDVCKERPNGLEPLEPGTFQHREGVPVKFTDGVGKQRGGQKGKSSFGPGALGFAGRFTLVTPGTATNIPSDSRDPSYGMRNFHPHPVSPIISSQGRFAASIRVQNNFVSSGAAPPPNPDRGEPRLRSQRSRQRAERNKELDAMQEPDVPTHGALPVRGQTQQPKLARLTQWERFNINLEPIEPLQPSENRWIPISRASPSTVEGGEALVNRKITSLLNKLTMESFDPISEQIIRWANESDHEMDGR